MLALLIFFILLSIVIITFYPFSTDFSFHLIKIIVISGFILFFLILILVIFDKSTVQPQLICSIKSLKYPLTYLCLTIDFNSGTLEECGIDGISVFFLLLTSFLIFLCFLDIWSQEQFFPRVKEFIVYFITLELFLIVTFVTLDLLIFFIFFESVLIPMFLIIGIWGSRERKIRADFYFFIYTLFGSIFLFLFILVLFFETYSTKFFILYGTFLAFDKECLLCLFSFLAFAVKIPMFPFHIWLPEAHVEAPTSGSVVLAGLLLKLGGYGCIRIILPILPNATYYFFPLISVFCVISIIYASLTTIRQIDLKRIIAYSSVAHMNVVLIGIFTCNIYGIQGAIYLMLAHGIVSAALFFAIGSLYKQHGTRLLTYYGGLASQMPLFSFYLLVFCLANIGTPATCNFIGEMLIFISLIEKNFFILLLTITSVILSVIYTMWLFNRVIFGNLKTSFINSWSDIDKKDNWIFGCLLFLTIFLGIFPNQILDNTYTSSFYITELMRFKLTANI